MERRTSLCTLELNNNLIFAVIGITIDIPSTSPPFSSEIDDVCAGIIASPSIFHCT